MNPPPPLTTNRMLVSLGPGARHHGPDGARQDPQIQPQRPVVDVLQVHAHPFIEIADAISPADLPQTRNAWTHAELSLVPQLVPLELVRKRGARSNEAHVALEHAPQLRQLVQAVLPEEPADARDARVVLDLEHRALH